jgi:hypothetical protein
MTFKPKQDAGAVFAAPGPERDAAVARIIRATGLPLQQPADKDYLAAAIFLAICDLDEMTHAADLDLETRRKWHTRFFKNIEECIKLGERDPLLKGIADRYKLPDLLRSLGWWEEWQTSRREAEKARREKARQKKARGEKIQRQPSALDWLIGLWLPLIYERCFGLRASWSWGSDPPEPAIRFIKAVLKELKLECADNTIRSAMKDLGRLRAIYAKRGVYTPAHADKKFTRPVAR